MLEVNFVLLLDFMDVVLIVVVVGDCSQVVGEADARVVMSP